MLRDCHPSEMAFLVSQQVVSSHDRQAMPLTWEAQIQMWEHLKRNGSPLQLRMMLYTTFGFGTGMRPGEQLADTTNPDLLYRCIGDLLLTVEGLLGLYLGKTKNNMRVWALNIAAYVLDVFVIYLSEYLETVATFSELSPLFIGPWTPDKDRYSQLKTGQLRAFIRRTLVDAGVCNEEDAMKHTGYSTRPGLVTALRNAGIPDYSIMLWTRHHSKAMERYDRPTPAMLLQNIQTVWQEAQDAGHVSPHSMVKKWLREAKCDKTVSTPAELRGRVTGLPVPAEGARKILMLSKAEAEKVRKSSSGVPLQIDFNSGSMDFFAKVRDRNPCRVGFLDDYDVPLVTKFPLKNNPSKNQVLGRIYMTPIKGKARGRWLDRHPGQSKALILKAKGAMMRKFRQNVAALPLPKELVPVSQASPLQKLASELPKQELKPDQPRTPVSRSPSFTVKSVGVGPPPPLTPPWSKPVSRSVSPPPLEERPAATISDDLSESLVPPPPTLPECPGLGPWVFCTLSRTEGYWVTTPRFFHVSGFLKKQHICN